MKNEKTLELLQNLKIALVRCNRLNFCSSEIKALEEHLLGGKCEHSWKETHMFDGMRGSSETEYTCTKCGETAIQYW